MDWVTISMDVVCRSLVRCSDMAIRKSWGAIGWTHHQNFYRGFNALALDLILRPLVERGEHIVEGLVGLERSYMFGHGLQSHGMFDPPLEPRATGALVKASSGELGIRLVWNRRLRRRTP